MSVKIIKDRVAKGIYLLRFKTQYELAATFLRVQEHYESPKFHGRIFSLEQYMDWYAARYGNFTYYQDWSGFNVPSTAFAPFYDGKFDPLSAKEKRLLRLFENLRERFYVIGIYDGGAKGSLTHELAHALFFTDAAYREAVRAAMRGYDTSALAQQLVKAGYAKHVIPDEVQAYLVAPSGKLGAASRPLGPLRRKLRALFKEHARGLSVIAAAPGGGASSARARRLSPALLAGAAGALRGSTDGLAFLGALFFVGRFFAGRFFASRFFLFFASLLFASRFLMSLLFAVGGVLLLLRVAVVLAFLAIVATPYRPGGLRFQPRAKTT